MFKDPVLKNIMVNNDILTLDINAMIWWKQNSTPKHISGLWNSFLHRHLSQRQAHRQLVLPSLILNHIAQRNGSLKFKAPLQIHLIIYIHMYACVYTHTNIAYTIFKGKSLHLYYISKLFWRILGSERNIKSLFKTCMHGHIYTTKRKLDS